ncbi:MAG: aldehyde ferredoxin oxidoreductase family protein [Clostridiales bacterium]|nr:aldehyde ferredoxin oxidoreductase family protein [Clostridiales bacterium]
MWKNAKILYVDLTERTARTEELDAETWRKYPGGSALGMYLMLKGMYPAAGPLTPENMLIFSVSPLTGLPVSGLSRMCVTTKSPLTGTAGDSQVGGFIPAHLAASGYASVVITGKADAPVYLYIDKEKVEIKDAGELWGMTTDQAEEAIARELSGEKTESSIIGPAGENLVKYAAIIHMKSRANGRNGTGAVMGSKNLKALVVKRQQMPKPFDKEGLKTLTGNVKERIAANQTMVDTALHGSAICVDAHAAEGFLPSFNWEAGIMDDWQSTAGTTITETVLKERDTCFGCAVRCKGVVEIEGKVDPKFGGPEYETCSTFGSYCGNSNLEDICLANQLCNMYGIDTISCGATIAWAMECYEKGILTANDTDGIDLKFGNGKSFGALIKKIAYREAGIGNLLAEGSALAAKAFGQAAEDLVVATKGQEWPAHMVQFKPNLAVNYAVNNFGADHQSSEHDPALMAPEDDQNWAWPNLLAKFEKVDGYGILDDNKAKFAFVTQKFYSMMDTLCLCQFVWGPAWQLYGPEDLILLCKYATGWDTSIEELQEIGERRLVMMRMFNAKTGFGRKDDSLPKKALLPITDSAGDTHQLTAEGFEAALDSYYSYAGWNAKTGVPTKETLSRLGLEWL